MKTKIQNSLKALLKEWKIKPVDDVAVEYLKIIIQKYKYSNSLINIFGINNEDSSQIELKILRVCLNSELNDLKFHSLLKYFHDEEKFCRCSIQQQE